ncbi:group 1 glycosyltransferase [Gracilibacillus halophilus YIM-C55.5]|uniref:Group 1 glycosyltransferase n=1 Tax=Gracilibacillus halophilus YIM-C55.5 TaxID=1308866 RepID=N4WGL7_9BACI|nr:FkbM family methyltransferase [Gracilibacillus halophilus]ENH98399.1 group 1 glycosyltransferase [Gracilibacillus halophilus YIM-C55.5]
MNKVIFVSSFLKNYVLDNEKSLKEEKTVVIPNGVNLSKYKFKDRNHGFKIAHIGFINFKKGPMLLLQAFKTIYDLDNRYTLHIAGEFQQIRYVLYYQQMINEMGLENNVYFEGWQEDIDDWLDDKNYILTSSVLESQHMSVMEAMSKGIKPLVHNFVAAKEIYDNEYIWTNVNDIIELLRTEYESHNYYNFVKMNYSLETQLESINNLVFQLLEESKEPENKIIQFYYDRVKIFFSIDNPQDHIQKIIQYNKKFYELGMLEDIKSKVDDNATIIDIGANIGNHTVYFGKVCKSRVLAFEPQIEAYSLLCENIRINNLQNKVKLFNSALGKEKATGSIVNQNINNTGAAEFLVHPNGNISLNKLDDIIDTKLPRIAIIKIDVEGMELDVLEGAQNIIKYYKPYIYVETKNQDEFKKISSYLSFLGYKPTKRFNNTPTILFISKHDQE